MLLMTLSGSGWLWIGRLCSYVLVTLDSPIDQFDDAVAACGQARVVRHHQERGVEFGMHAPHQDEHLVG